MWVFIKCFPPLHNRKVIQKQRGRYYTQPSNIICIPVAALNVQQSFLLPNFSLRNIQNVHMNASAYIMTMNNAPLVALQPEVKELYLRAC